jgi:hemerythrin-like domain-containing protein
MLLGTTTISNRQRRCFVEISRRKLVVAGTTLGITGLAAGLSRGLAKEPSAGAADTESKEDKEAEHEEEASPIEDLMREHGALRRGLLVYGECLRRLHANQDLPPKALADTAGIVRSFVEDYHEKLEEDYLFPRFKKANRLVVLVDVLLAQHRAGRRLTDTVSRLSTAASLKSADDGKTLAETLHGFIRLYNPHAAREDTVLFPALHGIVSAHEYDSLGEDFEKKEQQLFGADGFGMMVDRIAAIEKSLGIYDLAGFTPQE